VLRSVSIGWIDSTSFVELWLQTYARAFRLYYEKTADLRGSCVELCDVGSRF
jgi:hypothetical protein